MKLIFELELLCKVWMENLYNTQLNEVAFLLQGSFLVSRLELRWRYLDWMLGILAKMALWIAQQLTLSRAFVVGAVFPKSFFVACK